KNDPYGTRTRVTAVKGRCLNRLTKGPCYKRYSMAEKEGFEPSPRQNRPTPLAGPPLQPLEYSSRLAAQLGDEPTTDQLTADCSTTELLWNIPKDITTYIFFC